MDKDCIRSAAQAIAEADAILVTAGAGMGVDSGLPDFRSENGFWNAYPVLKHLELRFEDMAVPGWFSDRPAMAWAFYGHRQALYRETEPHPGFDILKSWCDETSYGYCVYTSNVDGHFQKAGFPWSRVVECHGNIHVHQCSKACTDEYWLAEPRDLRIDLEEMRIKTDPPRCPACHAVARPNVLMFQDAKWHHQRKRRMVEQMEQWLEEAPFTNLVIIECGAGSMISTVRRRSELIAADYDATLIRINPYEPEAPDDAISIAAPALEALMSIDDQVQKLRRRQAAVRMVGKLTGQGLRAARSARKPGDEHASAGAETFSANAIFNAGSVGTLKSVKHSRVYAKPMSFRLKDNSLAWIEKFYIKPTYASMIEGLPLRHKIADLEDWATGWAQRKLYGKALVGERKTEFLMPRIFDHDSWSPILPPLMCTASIRSYKPAARCEDSDGSWLHIMFFADKHASPVELIEKAMERVHWDGAAEAYYI